MGEKRHYVVETKQRSEQIAEAELKRQGFVTYLPMLVVERRHKKLNTISTVLEPLFPSYLFVELDLKRDRWRCVNGTRGVKCLLGDDPERPHAVPRGTIEMIEQALELRKLESTQDDKRIQAGELARIHAGSFAGHIAMCTESRAKRVELLLSFFGRTVKVTLLPQDVSREVTA